MPQTLHDIHSVMIDVGQNIHEGGLLTNLCVNRCRGSKRLFSVIFVMQDNYLSLQGFTKKTGSTKFPKYYDFLSSVNVNNTPPQTATASKPVKVLTNLC